LAYYDVKAESSGWLVTVDEQSNGSRIAVES